MAGIDAPAFRIGNAKWQITGPLTPPIGQWVDFDVDLHALFVNHWGEVPRGFEWIRVFFEARFDGAKPTDPASKAVVYFDELYLGTPETK